MAKAVITRAGEVVASFDENGKSIKKKDNQYKEDKRQMNIQYGDSIKQQPNPYQEELNRLKDGDFIAKLKYSFLAGSIGSGTIATCIVGELRRIYFKSINKPDGYDLEILSYMDKILFNSLNDIIDGIIRYGTSAFDLELLKRVIENAISIMEVQPNRVEMFNILTRLYEEFNM